jgi:hypothetical protein
MSFNKIQPEQLQLPTFYSDSGDILISQGTTGVQINLSRGLTGVFNFTGELKLNKWPVLAGAETGTNAYDPLSGNFVINGNTNTISGLNNTIINGINTTISGNDNVSLNGYAQEFGSGVEDCTVLAGSLTNFNSNTTGSVILADTSASLAVTSLGNQTLNIGFLSGTYFQGGDTNFLTDFNVASSASGYFSGGLHSEAPAFVTGSPIATESLVTGQNRLVITGQKRFVDDSGTLFKLPNFTGLGSIDPIGAGIPVYSGQVATSGDNAYIYANGWKKLTLTSV